MLSLSSKMEYLRPFLSMWSVNSPRICSAVTIMLPPPLLVLVLSLPQKRPIPISLLVRGPQSSWPRCC